MLGGMVVVAVMLSLYEPVRLAELWLFLPASFLQELKKIEAAKDTDRQVFSIFRQLLCFLRYIKANMLNVNPALIQF
jgi:hypothetical protein